MFPDSTTEYKPRRISKILRGLCSARCHTECFSLQPLQEPGLHQALIGHLSVPRDSFDRAESVCAQSDPFASTARRDDFDLDCWQSVNELGGRMSCPVLAFRIFSSEIWRFHFHPRLLLRKPNRSDSSISRAVITRMTRLGRHTNTMNKYRPSVVCPNA